jgi:hypothetical protein
VTLHWQALEAPELHDPSSVGVTRREEEYRSWIADAVCDSMRGQCPPPSGTPSLIRQASTKKIPAASYDPDTIMPRSKVRAVAVSTGHTLF